MINFLGIHVLNIYQFTLLISWHNNISIYICNYYSPKVHRKSAAKYVENTINQILDAYIILYVSFQVNVLGYQCISILL